MATHAATNSPLRRMSEVPHAISARFRSLWQWIGLGSDHWAVAGRVHAVLRVRQTGSLHKVCMQRIENLYGLETSALPGLWNIRRNCFAQ